MTGVLVVALVVYAFRLWQAQAGAPLSLTGPNLVANHDFAVDADGDNLPDGWTTAGVGGVERGRFTVEPNGGYSLFLSGVANWIKTPWIAVQPGDSYRVGFQALADDPAKQSPTQVEIWFHWRDQRGTEFSVEYSAPGTVPYRQWAEVSAGRTAPARATHLAASIRPLSDDRIVIDQFALAKTGVYLHQWPYGKQAALAFSFDYETAMGGLVHGQSADDPLAGTDPLLRAQRMRAGAEALKELFAEHKIHGTFYVNGYNLLEGNRERRSFMNNPTYLWATTANGWPTDYWATHPWFGLDPYTDEQHDPGWYFGSQTSDLAAAGHAIESHTFAHFSATFATPDDWQADFAAWKQLAGERALPSATSLAFPWSSSAGMSTRAWQILRAEGIRSVTRTNWRQSRFALADRTSYALRPLPVAPDILVMADEYLSGRLPEVEAALRTTALQGGALDIWAHTEEAETPEQRVAWERLIAAAQPTFWIAPVAEIVDYYRAVERVEIKVRAEQPRYIFEVANPMDRPLNGVTLTLPFTPAGIVVGGAGVQPTGNRLMLDLKPRQTVEINIWPA